MLARRDLRFLGVGVMAGGALSGLAGTFLGPEYATVAVLAVGVPAFIFGGGTLFKPATPAPEVSD